MAVQAPANAAVLLVAFSLIVGGPLCRHFSGGSEVNAPPTGWTKDASQPGQVSAVSSSILEEAASQSASQQPVEPAMLGIF